MSEPSRNPSVEPSASSGLSASARRLRIASGLFAFAYNVKKHRLSIIHPTWSQTALHDETMRLIDAAAKR